MQYDPVREKELSLFAMRLNERLDSMDYPNANQGRQTQLSKDLKADQKAVRRWLKGLGYPSDEKLKNLAEFLSMDLSLLRYGKISNIPINFDSTDISGIPIPVYTMDQAYDAALNQSSRETFSVSPMHNNLKIAKMKVVGTSMENKSTNGFAHGSYIYFTPAKEGSFGDTVLARLNNGSKLIRTIDVDNGQQILRPLNRQYPILNTDFEIFAVVIGKYQVVKSSRLSNSYAG